MSVSITIDLYSVHVHLSRVDSPAGGSPRVAHKLTTDSKRVVSLTLNCPFSRVLLQLTLYCHGNFGPAEKLVRGTKISGISVQADHFFLKILVPP